MLALVLIGGVVSFMTAGPKVAKKTKPKTDLVFVNLPPPPPPPPPPPKVEPPPPKDEPPPKEEDMPPEEAPPDEPQEAPADEPPADDALGTNNKGNGPDMGLVAGGGSGRIGGKAGSGGIGGDGVARYKRILADSITAALQRDSRTNKAKTSVQLDIKQDSSGQITDVQVIGTSGNPDTDRAYQEVLLGLQLSEPPPSKMKKFISLRTKPSR